MVVDYNGYEQQRKGKLSWNPFIFMMDILSQRIFMKSYLTPMFFIIVFVLSAITILWLPLEQKGIYIVEWFWLYLLLIFRPDFIYRHFRHRYLQKHNLPGPYGWGTVDSMGWWRYEDD